MPKPKPQKPAALTDATVRQAKPSTQRVEIRDGTCPGLVLRVSPGGTKTFALHTRSLAGRTCTITLGHYPDLGLKEARTLAREYRLSISRGEDPKAEKRKAKAAAAASQVTLSDLLNEAETRFGPTRVVWRANERYGRKKPEARAAIENVFAPLLKRPLVLLTPRDFADAMATYKPLRPRAGKATANGSVSRALCYLRTVMDWAAGRDRFRKVGAGRQESLPVADLSVIHDPAQDDETLEVRRERALTQSELEAVLPLLTYPAPVGLRERLAPEKDYGPAAMAFLLLTLSRRDEVSSARNKDVDLVRKTWTKEVKTKPGGRNRQAGKRRIVTLPLSDAAVELLMTLPSVRDGGPEDLIFPSSNGGRLGNWDRTQKAIHHMSRTEDWHRHDLRRTASTILNQFGVQVPVVDELLSHVSPLGAANVSQAAEAYILSKNIIARGPEPLRVAVEVLAAVLCDIAPGGLPYKTPAPKPLANQGVAANTDRPEQTKRRSPWAA